MRYTKIDLSKTLYNEIYSVWNKYPEATKYLNKAADYANYAIQHNTDVYDRDIRNYLEYAADALLENGEQWASDKVMSYRRYF